MLDIFILCYWGISSIWKIAIIYNYDRIIIFVPHMRIDFEINAFVESAF